jgi:hypothetical protein
MNDKAEAVYQRLQQMYEIMSQSDSTEDIEKAIFAFEDCETDADYDSWLEKYNYYC